MATFFPTSTEARAVVTWVRKHPFVSALAAAAAVASVVQFVRKERARRPKRPRDGAQAVAARAVHGADDSEAGSGMHRSVSWCDEGAGGQPLTHVIEQMGPGRPMEAEDDDRGRKPGRSTGDTPQSQDQWGWYVAMTPPEDQFGDHTPSTAGGRTPQARSSRRGGDQAPPPNAGIQQDKRGASEVFPEPQLAVQ